MEALATDCGQNFYAQRTLHSNILPQSTKETKKSVLHFLSEPCLNLKLKSHSKLYHLTMHEKLCNNNFYGTHVC
jgi:hypothetical protein